MSVTVAKRTLLPVTLLVAVVAAANAWLFFGRGQLGTNIGVSPEQLSRAMDLAAGVDRVIFVNVVVPRQWETETNE